MKQTVAFMLAFFFTMSALAQEKQAEEIPKIMPIGKKAPIESKEDAEALKATPSEGPVMAASEDQPTEINRDRSRISLLGQLSAYGIIIPIKYGGAVTLISSDKWSWEASYMQGYFNLPDYAKKIGAMNESHIGFYGRLYPGNSFNIIMGVGYHKFSVKLHQEFVDNLGPNAPANADLLLFESLGLTLGVGNRWQLTNGFTIGVDWVVYNQPISQLSSKTDALSESTSQSDIDQMETFVKVLRYLPQFQFLKLGVGYTF